MPLPESIVRRDAQTKGSREMRPERFGLRPTTTQAFKSERFSKPAGRDSARIGALRSSFMKKKSPPHAACSPAIRRLQAHLNPSDSPRPTALHRSRNLCSVAEPKVALTHTRRAAPTEKHHDATASSQREPHAPALRRGCATMSLATRTDKFPLRSALGDQAELHKAFVPCRAYRAPASLPPRRSTSPLSRTPQFPSSFSAGHRRLPTRLAADPQFLRSL